MKCPCLSTHIYSTINTSMVSDLHQMSRQPIRLHCSFLGFHSTQRHWYIQCHVQHTTNTVEHKSTTVMAEHVLAQRHTPPFLKKNRPCNFIMVLSHYDAHSCCCHFTHNITTQTNSIPRITTSAATGACLTTLPRPVGSIISVQSTGARTYCRHVDSAAAYRYSAYSNIGTTANFNTINTPGSIARIPSARGG